MILFIIVNIKFLNLFFQNLTSMLTKFPKNDKLILKFYIIKTKLLVLNFVNFVVKIKLFIKFETKHC